MRAQASGEGPARIVRVWDLPVRLFHWTLVPLLLAMWWTGEEGELETHARIGTVVLGLLVFRILWGLVGSETARFASFLKGPGAIRAYLAGSRPHHLGHNPLGGWSVAAILLLLLAQTVLGLFAQDIDGMFSGPLNHLVSYETGELARTWHHRLFNLVLALGALHILAITWYLLGRSEDLLLPMITGRKAVPEAVREPARASPLALVVAVALAVALAWWVGAGAPLPELSGA